MIILEFQGGLGNQMFQYAFFEELRFLFPDEDIFVDLYDYNRKALREYELKKIFGIEVPSADKKDILRLTDKVPGCPYLTVARKRIEKALFGEDYIDRVHKNYYIFVDSVDAINRIKGIAAEDYYLSGWWQNENCFFDVRDIVVNKFSKANILLEDYIPGSNKKNTVAVHVRRGDYVQSEELNILTIDYYKKAIDYVESKENDLLFVFFSDDSEYVKEEFGFIKDKIIVSQNTKGDSYKDMLLMSKCKHNIIANSTFSWWGAYLNMHTDKIVVAPSRYSGNKRVNLCSPGGWKIIDV